MHTGEQRMPLGMSAEGKKASTQVLGNRVPRRGKISEDGWVVTAR